MNEWWAHCASSVAVVKCEVRTDRGTAGLALKMRSKRQVIGRYQREICDSIARHLIHTILLRKSMLPYI